MAGGRDFGDMQAMWRTLLAASYFNIPKGQCPTCKNTNRECGKCFCVQCNVGGVCKATFNDGGEHARHPMIRVWKLTGEFSVCVDDVRRFMPDALVHQIQLYSQNERANCKFVRKEDGAQSPRLRVCHGCNRSISQAKTYTNRSESPVCSLKCLLDHALAQQPAQQPPQQPPQLPLQQPAQPLPVQSGERRQRRKQNKESIIRLDYPEFRPQR